jgi:hypothetical protein
MKCHLYAAWEAHVQNGWCKVTGGRKKNPLFYARLFGICNHYKSGNDFSYYNETFLLNYTHFNSYSAHDVGYQLQSSLLCSLLHPLVNPLS